MVFSSIAQLVGDANRRLADRGRGAIRIDFSGRHLVVRGPEIREPTALIEAGVVVFELRAAAEEIGVRVEVDAAPGGVPTVWATMTVHTQTPGGEAVDVVWPAGPRVLRSERTAQQLSARELVAACERGALSEGVSVRVAPMPLPNHFGMILRANGEEAAAWFALGQAGAGIERLARRSGWVAYRRQRSKTAPPVQSTPWFTAQVEVWLLRRSTSGTSDNMSFQTDDWVGF